ncbi:MAG TPA: tetratricopeptide repeat protein, partial [Verrucomicrobiae bacterium]|nr:tetratricopeptide repeat protein [Verrucomicrobiae bacterium]
KLFWPADLTVLYPIQATPVLVGILAWALLGIITAAVLLKARQLPSLLVGWLWFLGTLVPIIGLVRYSDFVVAGRYAYIPCIGLLLPLTQMNSWAKNHPKMRWASLGLVGAALVAITSVNLPAWQNSFTLYAAALRVAPHPFAYNNRGMAYFKRGDRERAFEDFTQAIALNPGFSRAYNNRGSLLIDAGRYEEAIRDCSRAIQCEPTLASAFNNRGNARAGAGDLAGSILDYDRSIEISPGEANYYNNRAAAYFRLGQLARASQDLKTCWELGGRPHPQLVRDLSAAIERSRQAAAN